MSVYVYDCVCFLHPKVSLLFDNDGTVFFAMVMAVWGEFCAFLRPPLLPITFSAYSHTRVIEASLTGRFLQTQIEKEINKEVGLQGCAPAPLSFRPNVFWLRNLFRLGCIFAFCVRVLAGCFFLRRALPSRCHITEQIKNLLVLFTLVFISPGHLAMGVVGHSST